MSSHTHSCIGNRHTELGPWSVPWISSGLPCHGLGNCAGKPHILKGPIMSSYLSHSMWTVLLAQGPSCLCPQRSFKGPLLGSSPLTAMIYQQPWRYRITVGDSTLCTPRDPEGPSNPITATVCQQTYQSRNPIEDTLVYILRDPEMALYLAPVPPSHSPWTVSWAVRRTQGPGGKHSHLYLRKF